MKHPWIAIALLGFGIAVILSCAAAAPRKAASKKPAPKPPVKGTTQLPGDDGKIGVTYTMGHGNDALNFTLLSAEFSVEPFGLAEEIKVPDTGRKMLILRFTLQNPNPAELFVRYDSLRYTAVHADNQNYEPETVYHAQNLSPLEITLKPAQKIAAITFVSVPTRGQCPKLMIQTSDPKDRVLRYSLPGKVKALPALFADPADASGASVRDEIPGRSGVYYPMGCHHVQVTRSEVRAQAIGEYELEENQKFFVVTVTLRNPNRCKASYNSETLLATLVTADGEKVNPDAVFKSARDETMPLYDMPPLGLNEEAQARLVFRVPADARAQKLILAGRDSAGNPALPYAIDLAQ